MTYDVWLDAFRRCAQALCAQAMPPLPPREWLRAVHACGLSPYAAAPEWYNT